MKKLLLFFLFLISKQSIGQTYVLIPDANFASYLQSVVPTAMSGNLLDITNTLVTTTTQTLSVQSLSISNLSGIQYFSSLNYLNCAVNSLTSLPTLPNTLQTLYCGGNPLTSLPTLPNNLTYLSCPTCNLSSLPTLPPNLTYLICSGNHFPNLPSLPTNLTYLQCGGYNNSMTSLPVLPNTLTYLNCNNGFLTSLPALPNSLTQLHCSGNQLTSLPPLPSSLNTLRCDDNSIACFPIFPNSITNSANFSINLNPYNCLPNYVLPAMINYTNTPLCASGNSNGCPITTGIKHNTNGKINFEIYPNPTSDKCYIETNTSEKLNVNIYDINGSLVFSSNVVDKSSIDLTNLEVGVYTTSIKFATGISNKKLVIVR